MTNILLITSSLMGEASTSQRLAGEIVAGLRAKSPRVRVAERHLTPATMPHLTAETLQALSTPADRRTADQARLAGAADAVIEEVEAADVIVIAAPMYNFSITSTLKAWIDHLARAGRTFRYTAAGPEGLLKGKTVVLVESRGGVYAGAGGTPAMDFQEPYLRAVLGFVGLTDIRVVRIEGQAMGADPAAAGLAAAQAEARAVVAALASRPALAA